MSYGISFWPVPFFSTIQTEMAVSFGSRAAMGTWLTSVYSIGGTISFMVFGANSDLFGRRAFILLGNVLMIVGSIVGGTSHSIGQSIAAHVMFGVGGGACQMAAFSLPELLPNKWRHFAVVMADSLIFFDVIVGPVTARIALKADAWRYGYWGITIVQGLSFVVLALFYHPPKHPRGIPWGQALRELDYVGMISFTSSAAMILSGLVFVQYLPSTNPKVMGLLIGGFALLIFFALWETFATLKQPLAPTRLFTAGKGRTLTAPFVAGFVVTMFYYGTNILWPTMFGFYFLKADTPFHIVLTLATVQGFGIFTGAMILSFGGTHFKNWKWQMTIPITIMTFFGGMLAYVKPGQEAMGITFAYLSAAGYGYAQYLSIAYIQFGADQTELGIAGGLAGVARYAGGAVAVTMYVAILLNTQASKAAALVPKAAEAAGASPAVAAAVAAALPLGEKALEKVQG